MTARWLTSCGHEHARHGPETVDARTRDIYRKVPRSAIFDTTLSDAAIVWLLRLSHAACHMIYPSTRTPCDDFGLVVIESQSRFCRSWKISRDKFTKVVAELEDAGYLKVLQRSTMGSKPRPMVIDVLADLDVSAERPIHQRMPDTRSDVSAERPDVSESTTATVGIHDRNCRPTDRIGRHSDSSDAQPVAGSEDTASLRESQRVQRSGKPKSRPSAPPPPALRPEGSEDRIRKAAREEIERQRLLGYEVTATALASALRGRSEIHGDEFEVATRIVSELLETEAA